MNRLVCTVIARRGVVCWLVRVGCAVAIGGRVGESVLRRVVVAGRVCFGEAGWSMCFFLGFWIVPAGRVCFGFASQ
jgi:hypothetical protein